MVDPFNLILHHLWECSLILGGVYATHHVNIPKNICSINCCPDIGQLNFGRAGS